jgi:hypothetical protein
LESTRSKYLASEQKITELKIALQAAELNSEAKVNHDERQKEELLQLRKLNRKLDREISMYKVHTAVSGSGKYLHFLSIQLLTSMPVSRKY